jgi:type II secretory pathway component GspD/PulD (secretin)
VLEQIESDFYIAPDHIRVTIPAVKELVTGPARSLREIAMTDTLSEETQLERPIVVRHSPTVTASFKDVPLAEAIRIVGARTGRSIVIAADAAEKSRATITVSFANTRFETTVSSMAEAAGLRAYRQGNVVVLVSPERAKVIETPSDYSGGWGCCGVSLGSGRTVTLDELESITRLFGGARPIDADAAKQLAAKKQIENQKELDRLVAEKKDLEEKLKKLTEELEKGPKRE